jgi:hydrogenase maturation protein HypF
MKECKDLVGAALVPAAEADRPADGRVHARVTIRGAVQGVGFRPCVFRLATDLGLSGWVNNSAEGVFIELEGLRVQVERFILRIERDKPLRSFIQSLETSWLEPAGYSRFEIRASDSRGTKTALVLPDIAICPDCLREIFDPGDRRYLYPFTNCTNCGPRFSIIEALPYDRSNTSMRGFEMCARCRAEYENPLDRRFHTQPNACPDCGPRVELWEPSGNALCSCHSAIEEAGKAIGNGKILAVKGLGGFHLMVDARSEEVVRRLRKRKHREEKPFAVMFPSLEAVRQESEPSEAEERLLRSAESPIVLLRRKSAPR